MGAQSDVKTLARNIRLILYGRRQRFQYRSIARHIARSQKRCFSFLFPVDWSIGLEFYKSIVDLLGIPIAAETQIGGSQTNEQSRISGISVAGFFKGIRAFFPAAFCPIKNRRKPKHFRIIRESSLSNRNLNAS